MESLHLFGSSSTFAFRQSLPFSLQSTCLLYTVSLNLPLEEQEHKFLVIKRKDYKLSPAKYLPSLHETNITPPDLSLLHVPHIFQDTHCDLEPSLRGSILCVLPHVSLRRFSTSPRGNLVTAFIRQFSSLVLDGNWSTVGGSGEKEGGHK